MKRILFVILVVATMSALPAHAGHDGGTGFDAGPVAHWDTGRFVGTVEVIFGSRDGAPRTLVVVNIVDRKTRYRCAKMEVLQPGQFIADPMGSIAVLDVPKGYCGATKITWTAETSAPWIWIGGGPRAEINGWWTPVWAGASAWTGFVRQASAAGSVGYRNLGTTDCAVTGLWTQAGAFVEPI